MMLRPRTMKGWRIFNLSRRVTAFDFPPGLHNVDNSFSFWVSRRIYYSIFVLFTACKLVMGLPNQHLAIACLCTFSSVFNVRLGKQCDHVLSPHPGGMILNEEE
jgi:hypothetical protein